MRRNIKIVLILLLSYSVRADNLPLIDSLNQAYVLAQHDTDKIISLLELGDALLETQSDTTLILWESARKLAEEAVEKSSLEELRTRYNELLSEALSNLAYYYDFTGNPNKVLPCLLNNTEVLKKLGDSSGLASNFKSIGGIYTYQGKIEKALIFFRAGLALFRSLNNDKGVSYCLNNIGSIYEDQGNIPIALEHYFQSLKLQETLGLKRGIGMNSKSIGAIYYLQGDLENALEYYQKALSIEEEYKSAHGISSILNKIGTIYQKLGNQEKALESYHKAVKLDDRHGVAVSLRNIGSIHEKQSNDSLAMEYYLQSLEIQQKLNNKHGISDGLNCIGRIHFSLGNYSEARTYAERSFEIAKALGFPVYIRNATKLLAQINKADGRYEEALLMHELYIKMRDSIKNEETQKATIRQETKYEFEKAQLIKEQKEKEVARLHEDETRRRDNLQYSVILIALLVIGVLLAVIGRFSIPIRVAEGLIFFSFLIFFEFILVLADPSIETWSGGAPGIKLLFNAGIAALIFPLHAFFETKLKGRLVK